MDIKEIRERVKIISEKAEYQDDLPDSMKIRQKFIIRTLISED